MRPFRLNRRTFLRGVAAGTVVGLGLPPLEAMFDPHGEKLANGSMIPTRFGVWFWGTGVKLLRWVPSTEGSEWELKKELEPIGPLRSKITIVSGTDCPAQGSVHHSGTAGMMCGAGAHSDSNDASVFSRPSIDMTVSEHFRGARLPFDRLNVAVCPGATEKGTPGNISFDGTSFNPAETRAGALFDRLTQAGMPSSSVAPDDGETARRTRARILMLDAIKEDHRALRKRLGATDRERLDRHLDGIRALQRRLEALGFAGGGIACGAGVRPTEVTLDDADIEARNQALSQVTALALACDMTRTFTYQFSTWYGPTYVMLGQKESLHTLTHDEPGDQPQVHAAVVFMMKQLSYFLGALDGVEEGARTLLDNCGILATSGVAEGASHSKENMPIVVGGRSGGALTSGTHIRSPGSSYRVHVAIMKAMGMESPEFGAGDDRVTEPLPGLLA